MDIREVARQAAGGALSLNVKDADEFIAKVADAVAVAVLREVKAIAGRNIHAGAVEMRITTELAAFSADSSCEPIEHCACHGLVRDLAQSLRASLAREQEMRREMRNETTALLDQERRRWYAALESNFGLIANTLEGFAPEVASERLARQSQSDALERKQAERERNEALSSFDAMRGERDALAAEVQRLQTKGEQPR